MPPRKRIFGSQEHALVMVERLLDRHGAARIVRRVTRRAGVAKHVGRHTPADAD